MEREGVMLAVEYGNKSIYPIKCSWYAHGGGKLKKIRSQSCENCGVGEKRCPEWQRKGG